MAIKVWAGQSLPFLDGTVEVTSTAAQWLPLVRSYLIGVARAGGTVTYGEMRRDLALPYVTQGMGYLLDVVSGDCQRRGEPSLAALVVLESTLEVAEGFVGDAAIERELLQRRWLSRTFEDGGLEQLGPIRGRCPSCGSEEITRVDWASPTSETERDTRHRPPLLLQGGTAVGPYDASCDRCERKWKATLDGKTARLETPADLLFYFDVATWDRLALEVSESFELDALVFETSEDWISIGFDTAGTYIEFPTTLSDFWERLRETHEEVCELLEAADD